MGLENYTTLFTDPAVRRSFFNVGIFLIINVPLTVVISLILATLLNRVSRLKTFLRVSFYVPVVAASVRRLPPGSRTSTLTDAPETGTPPLVTFVVIMALTDP